MSWTVDDVTRLERAIASGTKRVGYSNNRFVEYQSIDEMLKARDRMKAEIEAASDATGAPSSFRMIGGKGFG